MMKAIVQHGYGAPTVVLRPEEIEIPTVGDDQVLVRVHASSANPWDWHYIRGEPVLMRPMLGGVRKPKFLIPGGDVAGQEWSASCPVILCTASATAPSRSTSPSAKGPWPRSP